MSIRERILKVKSSTKSKGENVKKVVSPVANLNYSQNKS